MGTECFRTRLYQTSYVKDPASYGLSKFSIDLNVPPHISPSYFWIFFFNIQEVFMLLLKVEEQFQIANQMITYIYVIYVFYYSFTLTCSIKEIARKISIHQMSYRGLYLVKLKKKKKIIKINIISEELPDHQGSQANSPCAPPSNNVRYRS